MHPDKVYRFAFSQDIKQNRVFEIFLHSVKKKKRRGGVTASTKQSMFVNHSRAVNCKHSCLRNT